MTIDECGAIVIVLLVVIGIVSTYRNYTKWSDNNQAGKNDWDN